MHQSKKGFRLLAVHAHPDDESSKGAATMARYADEGAEVMVVTCTGGERGSILNPAMDRPGVVERMNEVRREEMAQAAGVLGVRHRWLGYVDSGLPEGDPLPPLPEGCFALEDTEEVTARLVEVIRDFRPHVIITYDENGGYPHPDHIKVHAVSMRAWDRAPDPGYRPDLGEPWAPAKIYYTHGFVRRRYETLAQAMSDRGDTTAETLFSRWRRMPDIFPRVTTRVVCGDWFDRRDDALRAHATQIDPSGSFFSVGTDLQRAFWPTEEFELAESRVGPPVPGGLEGAAGDPVEDDLFAGIPEDWDRTNTAEGAAGADPADALWSSRSRADRTER